MLSPGRFKFKALHGEDSLGPWLAEHPAVDLVSFSGCGGVGKKIMASCSKSLKRVIHELVGNDPAIVSADVDPTGHRAPAGLLRLRQLGPDARSRSASTSTRTCTTTCYLPWSPTQENISLDQGEGPGAIGPVSTETQYERVKALLRGIEESKLSVAVGSTKPVTDRKGFFLSPTIVENPPR